MRSPDSARARLYEATAASRLEIQRVLNWPVVSAMVMPYPFFACNRRERRKQCGHHTVCCADQCFCRNIAPRPTKKQRSRSTLSLHEKQAVQRYKVALWSQRCIRLSLSRISQAMRVSRASGRRQQRPVATRTSHRERSCLTVHTDRT